MILPAAYDWHFAYRPAALALLSGHSPYSITTEYFSNAPWGLIPLIPLAILPENVGRLLLIFVSLVAFTLVAVKLGAKPVALVAFLLSPFVVTSLYYGQIDWMPLLGILFPPQVGLFFIIVKPQTGIGIALFWLIEAWQLGGWRKIARIFAPVSISLALSLIVFGFWPINGYNMYNAKTDINSSMWPIGIILGVLLMARSWRDRSIAPSVAASPFFSPYVLLHSWSTVLLPNIKYQWMTVVTVIALWLLVYVR